MSPGFKAGILTVGYRSLWLIVWATIFSFLSLSIRDMEMNLLVFNTTWACRSLPETKCSGVITSYRSFKVIPLLSMKQPQSDSILVEVWYFALTM